MVLDTSALIAMLRGEPEAATFHGLLNAAQSRVSAATYLEAGIVVDGNRDPIVRRSLDELLEVAGVAIEPLTEQQARIARQAYRDFGQGSGHPARLNLGDCFSYALAKAAGEPLLFKGDDFIHTDVIPASR